MNKLLLLALMILIGIFAFAMGLFFKGSTTTLTQYVPDSVGEMFSQSKNNKPSETAKDKTEISFVDIPDKLVSEIQQDVTLDVNPEVIASIRKKLNNVAAENSALKEKFQKLNEESQKRDKVLQEIEQQIKEKLASQNRQVDEREKLIKELETELKNLNQ